MKTSEERILDGAKPIYNGQLALFVGEWNDFEVMKRCRESFQVTTR